MQNETTKVIQQSIQTLENVRNALGSFAKADVDLTLGMLRSESKKLEELKGQEPESRAQKIAECVAVIKSAVKGRFPHEQALEELVSYTHPQPAPVQEPCRHRIADARNPVVKSGYICVDCGALFSAAYHPTPPAAHPAQPKEPLTEWRRKHYPLCERCPQATIPMDNTCGWLCDGTVAGHEKLVQTLNWKPLTKAAHGIGKEQA